MNSKVKLDFGGSSSARCKRFFAVDETDPVEKTTSPIRVVNNKIFFYDDITVESILTLAEELRKLETKMLVMQTEYDLPEPPNIYLYIHSQGGDVYAGLSGKSTIRNCKVPVVCVVDGMVASAATFLLLGATGGRWMRRHSCVLIHQIRTEFWGRYTELKDEFKNSKNLMLCIKTIYRKNSKIPAQKVESLLKKELCLSARKCKHYGLIDRII